MVACTNALCSDKEGSNISFNYEQRFPTPPCLEDVFHAVDGLAPKTTPSEAEDHLGAAVLRFEGLSNGTFGCSRRTCGRLGKLFFSYPAYNVTAWPECPNAQRTDAEIDI
jgi:hypothetical protein